MCEIDEEGRRAVVVAAGGPRADSPAHRYITDLVRDGDLLVAADGGAEVLRHLGLTPDAVVGDLDSLSAGERRRIEAEDPARILRHPQEKDRTDGQLAAEWALERLGAPERAQLVICGAYGDRFDHSLAIILYAAHLADRWGVRVLLADGQQRAHVVCREVTLRGAVGDTVSLIPLTERVSNVHISGFHYPLSGGTLRWGTTLGVSNVLCAPSARVQVRGEGVLLAVHHLSDH